MPVDPGLGGRRRIGPDVSRASLCGRSKAKKGAFCSTLPMITIASPKSAWACPGAWASDTNFSRPLECRFGRVPLLAMDAEIGFEPGIDYLGEPIQLRLPLRCLAAIPGRHGEAQHLLHAIGDIPKRRAASRWLIPSEQARRALRYKSTVKILPPSLSSERANVATLTRPAAGSSAATMAYYCAAVLSDPTIECRVVYLHAALPEDLIQISVRHRVADVEEDRERNDFLRNRSALE
jgi:hypothetical protein